jgi:predicted kinase
VGAEQHGPDATTTSAAADGEAGVPDASRPELVVFVGLQGSGKTTCYRRRFAATHEHVSKDAWPNARHRQRRQMRLIGEALAAGRSVVVDNTNPTPEDRRPLVEAARARGATAVAVYFPASVADCLARNQRRQGRARVPDLAVLATARRLRPPSTREGFDRVHLARMTPDGTFELLGSPAGPGGWQADGRVWQPGLW